MAKRVVIGGGLEFEMEVAGFVDDVELEVDLLPP